MFSLSTKTLLLVLLSLVAISAKLTVRRPADLGDKFDKIKGIDYTVLTPQNKITYKKLFIGNLILPTDESSICDYVPPITSTGEASVTNPVIIATWGDCHYEQKVRNAEMAGAKMLLLVLKHEMQLNHPAVRPIQLDSSIQVIAISEGDGLKLIDYLKEQNVKLKDSEYDAVVEIKYTYDIEKHIGYKSDYGSSVFIDYWFMSGDETKQSYEVLDELAELVRTFKDKVVFTPRYVLWQHDTLALTGFNEDDKRCVCGGRYCDPEPQNGQKLFGTQSVLEDLRQICFRNHQDEEKIEPNSLWWRYVREFGNKCADLDMPKIDECREKVYKTIGVSKEKITKIDTCMKNSFEGPSNPDLSKIKGKNSLLEIELQLKEMSQIDYYPSLIVNGDRYQDSYRNQMKLQDFVCSHFTEKSMPSICTAIGIDLLPNDSQSDFMFYFVIVLISIGVMATMLYCVRRTVKRQVMGRMNEEISHIVTQYKQFKDKSTIADDDL